MPENPSLPTPTPPCPVPPLEPLPPNPPPVPSGSWISHTFYFPTGNKKRSAGLTLAAQAASL